MMNDRRLWTREEDTIITKLVQEHGCKKWTGIASEMSKSFKEHCRTSKQIRQRWYNHLDPEINKCPWSQQQEQMIFDAHKIHGSRWKEIAKLLHARTDNSVKNHFYSTLRRSLRRINKFLGFKNSTNQMRVIKPSILSQLVESAETNKQARMLVDRIFQFASFKPCKGNMAEQSSSIEHKDKAKYQNAIEKLVEFNNLYQRNKKQSKKKVSVKASLKKTKNHGNPDERSIAQVKIQDLPCQKDHSLNIPFSQQIQNQSTLSGKQNSSWSDEEAFRNGILPELKRPEEDFDFFGATNIPSANLMSSLMVTGNHIPMGSHIYPQHSFQERKNVCWFDSNQDSEANNRTEVQLLSNGICNQNSHPFQEL